MQEIKQHDVFLAILSQGRGPSFDLLKATFGWSVFQKGPLGEALLGYAEDYSQHEYDNRIEYARNTLQEVQNAHENLDRNQTRPFKNNLYQPPNSLNENGKIDPLVVRNAIFLECNTQLFMELAMTELDQNVESLLMHFAQFYSESEWQQRLEFADMLWSLGYFNDDMKHALSIEPPQTHHIL